MEKQKEELLAAALWAFIERLRLEQDSLAAGLDGLTPADAEELAAVFRIAEGLRLAMADTCESLPDRATERVEAAIARAQMEERRPRREVRGLLGWRPAFPSWLRPGRWSIGLAAAALLLGVLIGHRLPAPDPLGHPPAGIRGLSHRETRERIAVLMAGSLSPQETRAVIWHLAHCDRCFETYARMRSASRTNRVTRLALVGRAFSDPLLTTPLRGREPSRGVTIPRPGP